MSRSTPHLGSCRTEATDGLPVQPAGQERAAPPGPALSAPWFQGHVWGFLEYFHTGCCPDRDPLCFSLKNQAENKGNPHPLEHPTCDPLLCTDRMRVPGGFAVVVPELPCRTRTHFDTALGFRDLCSPPRLGLSVT